jgi:hypothetical protein
MQIFHRSPLVLLAALSALPLNGACRSGGCPVDHSELVSMDPPIDCLHVVGADGQSQCDTASLSITNNCTETLTFPEGWTPNGGKLVFPPGTSGVFDALLSMRRTRDNYEFSALLGSQTITFVVRTIPN